MPLVAPGLDGGGRIRQRPAPDRLDPAGLEQVPGEGGPGGVLRRWPQVGEEDARPPSVAGKGEVAPVAQPLERLAQPVRRERPEACSAGIAASRHLAGTSQGQQLAEARPAVSAPARRHARRQPEARWRRTPPAATGSSCRLENSLTPVRGSRRVAMARAQRGPALGRPGLRRARPAGGQHPARGLELPGRAPTPSAPAPPSASPRTRRRPRDRRRGRDCSPPGE